MGVCVFLIILFLIVYLPFQYRVDDQRIRHDYKEWKNNRR